MAETIPIARSPITQAPPVALADGWEVSARHSSAPLRLIDCTPMPEIPDTCSDGDLGGCSPELGLCTRHADRRRFRRPGSQGIGWRKWLLYRISGLVFTAHLTASLDGGNEPRDYRGPD